MRVCVQATLAWRVTWPGCTMNWPGHTCRRSRTTRPWNTARPVCSSHSPAPMTPGSYRSSILSHFNKLRYRTTKSDSKMKLKQTQTPNKGGICGNTNHMLVNLYLQILRITQFFLTCAQLSSLYGLMAQTNQELNCTY